MPKGLVVSNTVIGFAAEEEVEEEEEDNNEVDEDDDEGLCFVTNAGSVVTCQ